MIEIVLAAVGCTHIIVCTPLLDKFRFSLIENEQHRLLKLITCHQCLGFWIGFIFSLMLLSDAGVIKSILLGFITSLVADIVCKVLNKLF